MIALPSTSWDGLTDQDVLEQLTAAPPSDDADDDVNLLGGFWAQRPVLAHVHRFAQARMTSPWAVLGVVLTRLLVTVPPHVVLPPIVGGHGSLNTFVALVGPSGSGKGAAEAVAREAVDVGPVEVATAGSGEGLAHLYAHKEKNQLVRDRDAVLLTVPEIDNLMALTSRRGATLMPVLRTAWSGEPQGFSYADPSKALRLEGHTYRLGLVLGVQPGRAAPLLDDADGGTPQRFLWLPTMDPRSPDEDDMPAEPDPVSVHAQLWRPAEHGLVELPVPQVARRTIRENHRTKLRTGTAALDGHALFTRLKLAQALTFLDGRRAMTDEDWHLSARVMAVSDRTRQEVITHLVSAAQQANVARGRADGTRAAIADETAAAAAVQRVSRNLLRQLRKTGEPTAHSALRRSTAQRDRPYFDEAVAALVTAGQITEQPAEQGTRLALTEETR